MFRKAIDSYIKIWYNYQRSAGVAELADAHV